MQVRDARRWRRMPLAIATAALTATAAMLPLSATAGAGTAQPRPSITSSGAAQTMVFFHERKYNTAKVTAKVSDARRGSTLELVALRFPFTGTAHVIATKSVRGTATHVFTVRPALATKYQTQLYGPHASSPSSESREFTVYVVPGTKHTGATTNCDSGNNRPVCHQRFQWELYLPPAAASQEIAKHRYTYLGLARSGSNQPARPATEKLDRHFRLGTPAQVSRLVYKYSVAFSMRVGYGAYAFDWTICTKSTESSDGIGLPGRHGCGDSTVPASAIYLG